MIFKIEISEQADSDLRVIFEYIAFELESLDGTKKAKMKFSEIMEN